MPTGMDVYARIEQARLQAEDLKRKISECRHKQFNGVMGDDGLTMARRLTNLPRVRRSLKGHFGKVYALHWAGDSTRLVSASQDGKLLVWNAVSKNKVTSITLRSAWVMTCGFEQEKNGFVACGGLDNVCSIFPFRAGAAPGTVRASKELTAHDGYLSCCRFVGEGNMLTCSGDATCIYWDVERGEVLRTFAEHTGDVMSVSVHPDKDRNVFVSGSCDATAKVWDVRAGKSTRTLHGHESDINSVDLFPDGNAFGTGSDDST